jgi:ribonucleoside-diphosphate reductase beta chain
MSIFLFVHIEISSYLVGQVDSSVSSDDFDGFDL